MDIATPQPVPDRDALLGAQGRLAGIIRTTPILEVGDDLDVPGRVLLKLELTQHTGSFKARGALNAVRSREIPDAGVVTASGGNHGAAIAWAAQRAGVGAHVFVPSTSPTLKAERVASYGADLMVVDGHYPDALAASRSWAAEHDAVAVHAYDDPDVVAGQATLGAEISTQVPDASTVLVACGGGGLFAGVSLGAAEDCRVLPVEPERCPSLHAAMEAGGPTRVDVGGVAADSMGASLVGTIAHQVAAQRQITSVLVPDDAIVQARAHLWERFRILAEPGGATAWAGLLSGAYLPGDDDTTVVVISGGNTAQLP